MAWVKISEAPATASPKTISLREYERKLTPAPEVKTETPSYSSMLLPTPEEYAKSVGSEQRKAARREERRLAELAKLPEPVKYREHKSAEATSLGTGSGDAEIDAYLAGISQKADQAFDYGAKGQIGQTIAGGAQQAAGGLSNALAAATARGANVKRNEGAPTLGGSSGDAELDAYLAKTTENAQKATTVTEEREEKLAEISKAAEQQADMLAEKAQKKLETAKGNSTALGKVGVDIGSQAVQMAIDLAAGTVTGTGAMVPMAIRSFGMGAQEARQKGYDELDQFRLGVTSAMTEYFTEKLFGGNPVYDADVGLVNRMVNSVTKNKAFNTTLMKVLASTPFDVLNEGLEEIVSDIVNPLAELAITGNYDAPTWDEVIYDGAIGAAMSILGLGGQAMINNGRAAQQAGTTGGETGNITLPPPQEYAQQQAAARGGIVDVKTETAVQTQKTASTGETEKTSVNDNPAEHTPQEQRIIEEYKDAVDPDLVEFYNASKSQSEAQKSSKAPGFRLNDVSERASGDIEKYTGVNTNGWKTVFDVRQANHTYIDHGENGRADRSMAEPEDVGRMQYVLDNYDFAVDFGTTNAYWEPKGNGKNRQAKTVAFMKKVNGTYFIVEAAPNTAAKTVNIVTAFMAKKGKVPYGNLGKKVAEVLTQLTDAANAPQRYGQTATVRSSPAKQSVPQTTQESQEGNAGKSRYEEMQLPTPGENVLNNRTQPAETETPKTVAELTFPTPEAYAKQKNGTLSEENVQKTEANEQKAPETGTKPGAGEERLKQLDEEQHEIAQKLKTATGTEAEELRARFAENQREWSRLTSQERSDAAETPESEEKEPALDRLGVKIEEPITDTEGAERLREYAKGAEISRRELKRAIKELQPNKAEKAFAKGLADGTYTEGDAVLWSGKLFKNMDMAKVRELADCYMAAGSYKEDRIADRRRRNTREEEIKAMKLLEESDSFKPLSALRLNTNTMKRNILAMAGRDAGAKINARYFDPITRNSAERIRFENRMFDRVRKFELTKAESAMVQRVMEGTAVQDQVKNMAADVSEKIKETAQSEDFDTKAEEFDLDREQVKLAKRYRDWLDAQGELQNMDADKINAAAKAYTDAYNDFYDAINDFLVVHGYEPIGFIKGYAPHLQEDSVQSGVAKLLETFGVNMEVTTLPTDIAGRTESFKPGKQWNPYFQHRNSDIGQIDAAAGYESYVHYLSNILYHTDDIQKLRVLANAMRQKYAPQEIRDNIEWAQNLRTAPKEVKAEFLIENGVMRDGERVSATTLDQMMDDYVDKLFKEIKETTKFGDFVSVLDDYANRLAGKQTKLDRSVESFFGRRMLNLGNALSRVFGESAVVGNLSSAFNQISQLPAVQAEVGNKYVLQAARDILRKETEMFDTESDFITGKRGTEGLLSKRSWADSTGRQRKDKITEAMSIPFEAVDGLASRLYVRAKYLAEIQKGASHEEALRAADDFAEKVVGSRIQGAKPMAFESKNPFVKLVTTFQLEIANGWEHIRQDLTGDIKETAKTQGKAAAVKQTASLLARYTTEAFLLNRLCEAVYGGTPALYDVVGYIIGGVSAGFGESTNSFLAKLIAKALGVKDDDEEKEFDAGAGLKELGSLVVGDLPYIRNAASLLGYGDSNLPLPTLPMPGESWSNVAMDAATWLPGGNQIKKTTQGITTIARGGRYKNGKLMYPVDTSGFGGKLTAAKAILFGNSALQAADDYFASDTKQLSEKQTEMYNALVDGGEDMNEVYNTVMKIRAVKDVPDSTEDSKAKRDIIRAAEVSDLSKAALYSTMIGDSRDEDFAYLMDSGMTWDDVMDAYDAYEALKDKEENRATEYARWADGRYDEETASAVKETFKFWYQVPEEAKNYEKYVGFGLSEDEAQNLTDGLAALEPEKGNDEVSKWQKAKVIDQSGLDDDQLSAVMADVLKSDEQLKGWKIADKNGITSEYIDALEYQQTKATGVKDDRGRTVEGSIGLEVMQEIDSYDLTNTEKGVLYQALGYDGENMWRSKYKGPDFEAYYYLNESEREKYWNYCSEMTATKFTEYITEISTFHNLEIGGKVKEKREDKVRAYINGLKLPTEQKNGLYLAAGYKESTLNKCPWYSTYQSLLLPKP